MAQILRGGTSRVWAGILKTSYDQLTTKNHLRWNLTGTYPTRRNVTSRHFTQKFRKRLGEYQPRGWALAVYPSPKVGSDAPFWKKKCWSLEMTVQATKGEKERGLMIVVNTRRFTFFSTSESYSSSTGLLAAAPPCRHPRSSVTWIILTFGSKEEGERDWKWSQKGLS